MDKGTAKWHSRSVAESQPNSGFLTPGQVILFFKLLIYVYIQITSASLRHTCARVFTNVLMDFEKCDRF